MLLLAFLASHLLYCSLYGHLTSSINRATEERSEPSESRLGLLCGRPPDAPPPYLALPLLVLWANLHGSVILALGLIGPAVLEALVDEKRSEWPRVLMRWLPFTALAVAACCLTPYGADPLLIPLRTLGLGDALNWIGEWRPQDFGHFGTVEFLLLAGIFALSRGLTLLAVRALVVLGLIHFALAQVRNADLLAMLAPLYLAAPLARQFGEPAEDDAADALVDRRHAGLWPGGVRAPMAELVDRDTG